MSTKSSGCPLRAVLMIAFAIAGPALGGSPARAADIDGSKLFPGGIFAGVGWSMAVAGDAFNPLNEAPGSEKLDLAPFIHTRAVFGDGSGWSVEANAIYANFGRLVNKTGVEEFSDQTSGTEARRAMIAEMTLKTPFASGRSAGVTMNVVNLGFIFDGQGESEQVEAIDAAGYIFSGPGLAFVDNDNNAAYADLLVGVSEVLTGDEVFNFRSESKHSIRIRPRFLVHFQSLLGGSPLQIGFWADLGIEDSEPDAATVFFIRPFGFTRVE